MYLIIYIAKLRNLRDIIKFMQKQQSFCFDVPAIQSMAVLTFFGNMWHFGNSFLVTVFMVLSPVFKALKQPNLAGS